MAPNLWVSLFLGCSALLCIGAAVSYLFADRPGMAIAFLCYGTANISLIWDAFCR